MEREIVVVGAGPGGATTAMALRELGHDVLLLDRQSFPRDKACGDGIPAGVFEIMYDFGMQEKVKQAGFYPATKLRIVSPNLHVFDTDLRPGERYGARSHVVPRAQFDALLQEHAVSMGAEFCQAKVKGPIVEDGQVKGVTAQLNGTVEEIRARLVIAADGVTSTIARALRPEPQEDLHRAVALRAYIDDIEELPNHVEFHLYKGVLPGYAWIFPLGKNEANIGLGMRLDKYNASKRSLKDLMQLFLEVPMIKQRLHAGGRLHNATTWQLNFGSQKNIRRAYDGAMLVGDAGGFINPLTGGGIHNAMISARLAAQTAHEALAKGDVSRHRLQVYEQACHDEMWDGMKRAFFIQRWLLRLPFAIDFLVGTAGSNSSFAGIFMDKL